MKWPVVFFILFLISVDALATDYIVRASDTSAMPYCQPGWSRSGNVYSCAWGQVVLNNGDTIQVSAASGELLTDVILSANGGFVLNNNVIGSAAKTITLQSSYGAVQANGGNTIYGNIISSSGPVILNNTSVSGSISTQSTLTMNGVSVSGNITANNGVNLTDVDVAGTITSQNGAITLNGGQVDGLVHSGCCRITADGTDLYAGASTNAAGLYISNATIQGDFYAANNYSEFNNVIMLSGSINASSSVTLNNSTLGSSAQPITVTTESGPIVLNDTLAYGTYTTPGYTSVEANGTTVIVGECIPTSEPADACQATEPLTCLSDDFNRSETGNDWTATSLSGNFTPQVNNNRLLLTQDVAQQSTAVTLQRLFPAVNNIIVIEFDHYAWSSSRNDGADGMAVVLSDASITPQAGSYGGSLGYAQKSSGDAGFAGGWLGIALDEYGNFSNPTEGRIGGPGFRSNSVVIRGSGSGQSGYRFIGGAFGLNPEIDKKTSWWDSAAGPGYRYRITIDGRNNGEALVTIERDTGRGFQTLLGPTDVATATGQAVIPDNLLLSMTGATGANTNYHGLDNLEVCADTMYTIDELVHHFELNYASGALTCSPQEVEVRACANEDCSALYTGNVTLTLSPSGWEGGDTLTFSGGSGTFNLWHTTAETIELSVTGSNPLTQPYTKNYCSVNGGVRSENCPLNVSDAGFILNVDNIVAGQGTATATLQAVKTDDTTQLCVPAFSNVSRDVSFWSDYINPDNNNRVASWPVSVNGTDAGLTAAAAETISLSFDAEARAVFAVNYYDAGRMQLNAVLNGAGDDTGLELSGSDQFNSVPAGFCVKTTGECSNDVTDASSCPAFVSAGSEFTVSVQAVGWEQNNDADLCTGNTPTPDFAMHGMRLNSEIFSPQDGVSGSVSPSAYDHQKAVNNLNQITVKESEVGVFRFLVTAAENYLGVTLPVGKSEPTGRFYPHHFSGAVISAGEISAYCRSGNAFAYSGQSLNWLVAPRLQITARNLAGVTTRNYTEKGYLKLMAEDVVVTAPDADDSTTGTDGDYLPLTADLQRGSLSVASAGVVNYDFSMLDEFTYNKTLSSVVAPFQPDLMFVLSDVSDSDLAALDQVLDFSPVADFAVRYGRLWVGSSYGPETLDLTLDIYNQYFNGTGFIINTDDSCWDYDAQSHVALSPADITAVAGNTAGLLSGQGDDAILLTAPTAVGGSVDSGEVNVRYSVPLWLQDDFDGDGSFESPSGTATFGIYRGHDRVIYWREVR